MFLKYEHKQQLKDMEVKICKTCEGHGTIKNSLSYGDYEIVQCEKCCGTGKIITQTIHLELPYGEKYRDILNDASSEVINIMRKSKMIK